MAQTNKGTIKIKAEESKHFWYCYGTEGYLAEKNALEILAAYEQAGLAQSDVTVLEGPSVDLDELVAACGTISMFGGVRLVYLRALELTAFTDKEAAEFCQIVGSAENAVIVAFSVMKDQKAAGTKKAKMLISAAQENGMALASDQLAGKEMENFLIACAKEQGAEMDRAAARLLMESCGGGMTQLENEVCKLAAGSGYGRIDTQLIQALATHTVDADVFQMIDAMLSKNAAKTFGILRDLLESGNDEIAVCGAMAGSFVDMYRVKCAKEVGKPYTAVHKEMKYTGSDWRLKRSGERASRFSRGQLEKGIEILAELDLSLKSSAVDSRILLENAVSELISL